MQVRAAGLEHVDKMVVELHQALAAIKVPELQTKTEQ
jgi:hypothetical protein